MQQNGNSYISYYDENDQFHSLFEHQQNSNNRPTVFVRPQQRQSKVKRLIDIQESELESHQSTHPLLSELMPKKRQVVPIGQVKQRRIEILLQRKRSYKQKYRHKCSFDTSAALIKIMQRHKWVRYLMNLYIWLNICLRVGYVYIVVLYVVSNEESNKASDEQQLTQFYWWIPSSFIFIRILFILIIYKLLCVGKKTRDVKIKIVYDTYEGWFDKTINKRNDLQQQCDEMVIRNGEDELKLRKLQRELKSLNRWLLFLKTYILFIPPECQFIFLKQTSNGFFQVQNFIMKTLEILFFTPQLLYFLLKEQPLDVDLDDKMTYSQNNICTLVLLVDIVIFILMTLLLVCKGNQRKYYSQF